MTITLAGFPPPGAAYRQVRHNRRRADGAGQPIAADGPGTVAGVVPRPVDQATAACTPTSLEQAYRTLAPAVLGYFRSRGVPEPEDLVGDVFVGVARGLHRFRGDDTDLRRWVFTIAHRRLIDDRRRRIARPLSPVPELPEIETVDRSVTLDPDLLDALSELTPLQREVVLLRFVADLPLAAVARIVRRRVGAVKGLQSRALTHLAHRLNGD